MGYPNGVVHKIVIIVGSEKSDVPVLKEAKVKAFLDELGVSYEVTAASAHRDEEALREYVIKKLNQGTQIFVCAAGMAAVLPGAVKAIARSQRKPCFVVGAPLLASDGFAKGADAVLSILRMPPRVPVPICGVGVSGVINAVVLAVEVLALHDDSLFDRLLAWRTENEPKPKVGIDLDEA